MAVVTGWSPFFQGMERMHGRRLYDAAAVARSEPEAEDELVRAVVRDVPEDHAQAESAAPPSAEEANAEAPDAAQPAPTGPSQTVVLRGEGRSVSAECTCDIFAEGAYCRHIWATLLAIQQEPAGPGVSAEELNGLRARPPRARKRDEARTEQRGEPAWVSRLSLLRSARHDAQPAVAPAEAQRAVARRIRFAVIAHHAARHQAVIVELRQSSPTATGWGKPKPLRLNHTTLPHIQPDEDRELCALILGGTAISSGDIDEANRYDRASALFRLPPGAARPLLRRMIDTGRCDLVLGDEDETARILPLRWDDSGRWSLWVVGEEVDDALHVGAAFRMGNRQVGVDEPQLVIGGTDGLLFHNGAVAPMDDGGAFRWVSQFRGESAGPRQGEPIVVPRHDIPRFLKRLYMLPQLPEIDLPDHLAVEELRVDPQPLLELHTNGTRQAEQSLGQGRTPMTAKVFVDYAGRRVNPVQSGRFVALQSTESADPPADGADATDQAGQPDAPGQSPGDQTQSHLVRRKLDFERQCLAMPALLGMSPLAGDSGNVFTLPARRLPQAISELLRSGWRVLADQKPVRQAARPMLSIASGQDWFELRGNIRYQREDGHYEELPLPDILAAAKSGEQLIELGDGSEALLPEQWLEEHAMLATLGKLESDHLRFNRTQAALLDTLIEDDQLAEVDAKFAEIRERLRQFAGVQPREADAHFHGTLRNYQKEGLGWLAFLRWFGMGGILADDMGLGKTIQVLAMLQARKAKRNAASGNGHDREAEEHPALPSLIVAPRSVVFNWQDEAEKFTPDLRICTYGGSERGEQRDAFADHDVIVTSYGIVRRDIDELKQHNFDYIVLDEAQAIKNPKSQGARAVCSLNANHRLALTGTPIENHLGDLWSIFEFLNPGMLGSHLRFAEMARAAGGNGGGGGNARQKDDNQSLISQVAAGLRPFILRRTKKQVLADLPEKTEQTIVCDMEGDQLATYQQLREYYRANLMKQFDGLQATQSLAGKSTFMVLEALLRLRQAACHPGLIDEARRDEPSAKLEALFEMLEDVIDEGGKTLIYSQFTSMLAIVRRRLDERGIRYEYLDGQTRDRRKPVDNFQNDPDLPVFLISLKAGGFGLNLTAAEYVFILDPWWNPAVESQAIDRTHRIGQTKPVFAYRLVCRDTVEQRILELQREKRQLAQAVIDTEQSPLREMTRADLERLLS